jgi:hypothetical protein
MRLSIHLPIGPFARRALLAAVTLLTLGVAMSEATAPASAATISYGNGVVCTDNTNETSTWVFTIPNVPTHTYTFKNFPCF